MRRDAQYWLKLVEPTPEELARHDSGSVIWAQCWRCGSRHGVALPGDLGDVARTLGAIVSLHERCEQTLLGARWELIVALRLRRWALLGVVPRAEES